jgi:hypothetical protein
MDIKLIIVAIVFAVILTVAFSAFLKLLVRWLDRVSESAEVSSRHAEIAYRAAVQILKSEDVSEPVRRFVVWLHQECGNSRLAEHYIWLRLKKKVFGRKRPHPETEHTLTALEALPNHLKDRLVELVFNSLLASASAGWLGSNEMRLVILDALADQSSRLAGKSPKPNVSVKAAAEKVLQSFDIEHTALVA